jgi:hypothetical protein
MRHYRQIRNNWCGFFATANWLMIDLLRTHKEVNVSPYWIIKTFFKKRGYLNVFKHLYFSYRDITSTLDEIVAVVEGKEVIIKIKGLEKVEFDNKRAVLTTINKGSHACVLVKQNGLSTIVDSQSKKQFREIKTEFGDFYIIKYEV